MITIDLERNPGLQFRLDSFEVPAEARDEFTQAMQRNLAFITGLPGFRGHVVFEKASGPTTFNIATLAVWESAEAVAAAAAQVRDYYQRIGFDTRETLARLGVRAEVGHYAAPPELQSQPSQEGHLHLARPQTAARGAQ